MGKLIVDDITRQIYCVNTPLVDVSNINDTTTFATKNCINTSSTFNIGGFTINQANGITVPVRGLYMVAFNCYMNSSGVRENVEVAILIEGKMAGISAHGYIRDGDGHTHSSVGGNQIFYLQPGQTVNLAFRREANSNTVALLGANSHLSIAKID